MIRRSIFSLIAFAVIAASAFLLADTTVVVGGLSYLPVAFASTFVVAPTVLFLGGLTRHSVLAAVQTLFRVRDRAFRLEVLAAA